jgi:hypothetical protein
MPLKTAIAAIPFPDSFSCNGFALFAVEKESGM